MSSITIGDLSWAKPDGQAVFSDLSLSFASERAGLVGRNGVGKTTLLKLLAGELQPRAGYVTLNGTVAMVRQTVHVETGETVASLFGVLEAMSILQRAEAGTASMEELGDADWTLQDRMAAALARVGFAADPNTLLTTLSGGQRTRVGLAAAIFREPDFLLLDEPTNNLDRDGRRAVIDLLAGWRSGAIVVSHDRELLEEMDATVEMTSLGARRYGGNWSAYRAMKSVELDAAEHDLAHAEKSIAEVKRKTQLAAERKDRRDGAGARKGAKGDMPRIVAGMRKNSAEASKGQAVKLAERQLGGARDSLSAAKSRIEVLQPFSIRLPSTGLASGRSVLTLDHVDAGHDPEHPIIRGLSLSIVGPERVAVTGPNGAGKTTLLKLVSGVLEPLRGKVSVQVPHAMLDQTVGILEAEDTILGNFMRLNPQSTENECRATLASFLFRADAALQRVATLSGGQMLRAGLACVLGGPRPPALLVLDEPTNHLDIDSIEAVEAALVAYDGALLVVSHDETFLENIGITRRLELAKEPT